MTPPPLVCTSIGRSGRHLAPMLSRAAVAALTAGVAIAALACGSGSNGPVAPTIESTTFAPSLGVNLAASTRTATGLYYRDLVVGGGAATARGMVLAVHYTGSLADGTQFDSNVPGNTPLTFTLGVGQVIAGWDEGLAGIRVGGRRQLIIPPSLGYGASGSGQIPGNAILVFTVDVISAQ